MRKIDGMNITHGQTQLLNYSKFTFFKLRPHEAGNEFLLNGNMRYA